ncbi:helix-turn-helix domain-containing protein [Burkholderia cenocepacia]|uniref:helix-turn-helix domain-containing protein n=1 Tax=Burkholderia cenocepacia TaxID=95486 RepID=UPI000AB8F343|nr:helix-turn-helix transcriptional regulator [Burkholderia cenocepacia]CAB5090225.1 putative DNA-binding protein [Burkholderia cenocepacia]CAB5156284.1 putative DNA-binding protein [Burkholderia cenocepacia]CAB5160169.1 putative DNA-binding protein [Burkholderia cenocepacia]CAB5162856.1 putative DNA-binding protein [Burkholderia cenocepacia]CAB5164375.1 putative DNA-binding protein [Burkholderia cenocepacia]
MQYCSRSDTKHGECHVGVPIRRHDRRRDELANATGLSPKFISQVEAGKPTAQIGKVMLLLSELGVRLYAESSIEISEATALKATQRRRSSHGG